MIYGSGSSYLWGYLGCGLKVQACPTGSVFRFRDVRPGSCSMDGVRPVFRPLRWLFTSAGFPVLCALVGLSYPAAYAFALGSAYVTFRCPGSDNVYTASRGHATLCFFVGCTEVACIPPSLEYAVCPSYFVAYRGLLACGAAVPTSCVGDVYADGWSFVPCSVFVFVF